MNTHALILYTSRNYYTCGQVMYGGDKTADMLNKYHSTRNSIAYVLFLLEQGFGISSVGRNITFYSTPYNNSSSLTCFTQSIFGTNAFTHYHMHEEFDNPEYVILLTPSAEDDKKKIWKAYHVSEGRQLQLLVQHIEASERKDNDIDMTTVSQCYKTIQACLDSLDIKYNPLRKATRFKLATDLCEKVANGKTIPNPIKLKEHIEKY